MDWGPKSLNPSAKTNEPIKMIERKVTTSIISKSGMMGTQKKNEIDWKMAMERPLDAAFYSTNDITTKTKNNQQPSYK